MDRVLQAKGELTVPCQLHSELDEVFCHPGRLLTRGQHFHDEAARLWKLQTKRDTVADLCTASIMLMSCTLRAKDGQGWQFLMDLMTIGDILRARNAPVDDGVFAKAREMAVDCTAFYGM